jgi:hypothetical protein
MRLPALINALFAVVRQGNALRNPALWKQRQMAVSALTAFLVGAVALARLLGLDLPLWLTEGLLAELAAFLVAGVLAFDVFSTAATSDKVGLPPKDDQE